MGLKASTLTYWSWKLRAAGSEGPVNRTGEPKRRAKPRTKTQTASRPPAIPKLIELPVAEVIPPTPMIELVLQGDIRVRVPTGFDESTLVRLMRAVEQAP